jgi:hypothetical protein
MGIPFLNTQIFMGIPFLNTQIFVGIPFLNTQIFMGIPFLNTQIFMGIFLHISDGRFTGINIDCIIDSENGRLGDSAVPRCLEVFKRFSI